ncbi:7,8-dihydro-8-oxoguanine triphosphatase [Linderina pennispora]|uniref:Oxidized purine nucleoside triphosphate hydrolase n=1 Tax=Linderina pennispora TaxID=61395 RepID=A0A1Y1W3G4_9FUNG|nr:7,8-dihydro-8-oxoguanine triphosphatase [Linderina pennispora]ORX67932.1 7,8-dihydro-8-oxoguanine triphosphatase [Linderina pennispora]
MPDQHYYTVVFPFSTDRKRVLLGLKKRGMGEGLWNGFGGKPEPGETMDQCAIRELQEESSLTATAMDRVAVLIMRLESGPERVIFVYTVTGFSGDVCESDEMRPRWFDLENLPYSQAYTEARIWWPYMLAGRTFVADFTFNDDSIVRQECREVQQQDLDTYLP